MGCCCFASFFMAYPFGIVIENGTNQMNLNLGGKKCKREREKKSHGLTAQPTDGLMISKTPDLTFDLSFHSFSLCLQTEYTVAHYISIFSSFCFCIRTLFWSRILINHAYVLWKMIWILEFSIGK